MDTGEWIAVGVVGVGVLGAAGFGWWWAEHQPSTPTPSTTSTTPSTQPQITLTPSTTPSTPSTVPPNAIKLVASEPKARTGQSVTLTARATYSGTPPNAYLHIVDLGTGQVVGSGSSITAMATVSYSQAETVSYQATLTVDGTPYTSNTIAVEWSQVATGTNQGRPNAAGQTVSITGPTSFTTGNMLTVSAEPKGFTSPVYQFWVLAPGGNWEQSGGYSAKSTWTAQANAPGQWNFAVYARESTAPTGEGGSPSEQAQYEAKSGPLLVNVSGGSYVSLEGPTVVSPGSSFTTQAVPFNIPDAQYQFWWQPPNGSWQQTPWQAASNHTWAAGTTNGTGQAIVYCRQSGTSYEHFSLVRYVTVGNSDAVPTSSAAVALSIPSTASTGQSVTFTASSTGITQPLYQFWYVIGDPSSSTWNSNGAYSSQSQFTLNASTPGTWQVRVYCRSALAPENETAAQQAVFERYSTTRTMTVS